MDTALDIVLEVFSWLGFGAGLLLGVVAVILWAADGTWLPADALVDHEDDGTVVRWFDADGDANAAHPSPAEAQRLVGADRAPIWYRHGWRGRMRLTRRAPGFRAVAWAAASMLALGVLSLATSWILLFARG